MFRLLCRSREPLPFHKRFFWAFNFLLDFSRYVASQRRLFAVREQWPHRRDGGGRRSDWSDRGHGCDTARQAEAQQANRGTRKFQLVHLSLTARIHRRGFGHHVQNLRQRDLSQSFCGYRDKFVQVFW